MSLLFCYSLPVGHLSHVCAKGCGFRDGGCEREEREEREGKREIGKRNTENEAKRGRSARRAGRDRGWTEEHVVLFAKTKFARDKHGQTLAGLVDFGVKSATKTQLHFVPTRRILFFYPSFRTVTNRMIKRHRTSPTDQTDPTSESWRFARNDCEKLD